MPNDITLEQVRRMAQDFGLTRLTEDDLRQLLRAARAARARRASLPTADLTAADEPAHVFHVDIRGAR